MVFSVCVCVSWLKLTFGKDIGISSIQAYKKQLCESSRDVPGEL